MERTFKSDVLSLYKKGKEGESFDYYEAILVGEDISVVRRRITIDSNSRKVYFYAERDKLPKPKRILFKQDTVERYGGICYDHMEEKSASLRFDMSDTYFKRKFINMFFLNIIPLRSKDQLNPPYPTEAIPYGFSVYFPGNKKTLTDIRRRIREFRKFMKDTYTNPDLNYAIRRNRGTFFNKIAFYYCMYTPYTDTGAFDIVWNNIQKNIQYNFGAASDSSNLRLENKKELIYTSSEEAKKRFLDKDNSILPIFKCLH